MANHNRLGFAVQLCYLRYPGFALPIDAEPPASLLALVGRQLRIEPDTWSHYAKRPETRREHLAELQAWLNLTPFAIADFRRFVHPLAELAQQTDRGIVLAEALVEMLRQQHIILPTVDVIERLSSEALTRGTRQVYKALTEPLSDHHRCVLDGLLTLRDGTKGSGLIWLRQPPGPPKPKHVLAHLERLKTVRELWLPEGPGAHHPPEPPAEARPRRRANDRPASARPGTGPALCHAGGGDPRHPRHAD